MKVSDENPGWHKAVYNDKVKCVKCDEILDDEQEFREHHESKHPGEPFICQSCNAELKDRAAYTKHKWTNHNRPYACDYCKFTSCKIPLVKKHVIFKHTGKDKTSFKQKARAEDKSNKFAKINDSCVLKEEKDNERNVAEVLHVEKVKVSEAEDIKKSSTKTKSLNNVPNADTNEENIDDSLLNSEVGDGYDDASYDDIAHHEAGFSEDESTTNEKSETKLNLRPKSSKSLIEYNSDDDSEQKDQSDNYKHSDIKGKVFFCLFSTKPS